MSIHRSAKGSGPELPCLNCNKLIKIPQCRAKTFKFCSRKCGWNYKNKNQRVSINCKVCKNTFEVIYCRYKTARYCSKKCYYKSMGDKTHGSIEKECKFCKKTIKAAPSRAKEVVFCNQKCKDSFILSQWDGKSFSSIRKAMYRRGLINKCEDCGYHTHIEILGIHHIDENHRNNSRENLAILCPNCHSIRHRKHIPH